MKYIIALLTILIISGCQSTGQPTIEKETNPDRLIKLIEIPKGKMVEPKITSEPSWVDFGVEFEKHGNGLKVANVKLVTASHPNSSSLINDSKQALEQWIFYLRQVRKFKGNRYLIKVTSPNPDRFCKAIGKKAKKGVQQRERKVICRLNTKKVGVMTNLFNEYATVNTMLITCPDSNPEQVKKFQDKFEIVKEYFSDYLDSKYPDYSSKQLQAVSSSIENKANARAKQMVDNDQMSCSKGKRSMINFNIRDELLVI